MRKALFRATVTTTVKALLSERIVLIVLSYKRAEQLEQAGLSAALH